MLSQSTIDKINDRIQELVRENGGFPTEQERTANLEEIKTLMSVLNPQPSRETIIREIADALRSEVKQSEPQPETFADAVINLMRRR